jgi:DNA-directed RNA polymerase subunit beta'
MLENTSMTGLRISLASPEQIRSWSHGEVMLAETINYLTHKPEPGGLFCERIFGPTKDWSCACGKYKCARTPGFICEQCGVEVAPKTVRRERMGHIELSSPVAHPWYARGTPSIMALLLDLSARQLSAVLSFARYVVIDIHEGERKRVLAKPDVESETEQDLLLTLQGLTVGDLLEEGQYRLLSLQYAQTFRAATGAEAIRERLASLDLETLAADLRQIIQQDHRGKKKAMKRLQVVEAFRSSGLDPTWMILSVLPVLPPDLRPLVPLDGGRFATSDLNALYERILHRNQRLKQFLASGAPEAILNNEKRLLQDACDALFDNGRMSRPVVSPHGDALKSLTDILKSKHGRLRRNLLGKRVDYSGRSVITAGLDLQLHQCGLPTKICLELFKPFLIGKLLARHYAPTARAAKRMLERKKPDPIIWDLLEEVMHEKVVLLNRAPTLHRLSIQAFEAVRVEGNAIQLHPLVCSAFNADFDGDQMAVHLPLSDAAQAEARALMLSTRNLRSPATGEPSISISQDMVLGCFYLTQDRPSNKAAGRIFTDREEAQLAYERGLIDLHTRITVRLPGIAVYETPPPASPTPIEQLKGKRIESTLGRLIFNDVLPQSLRFRNYAMKKEHLKQLIGECLSTYGAGVTAQVADALKRLGFHYATRSGISFALSDVVEPPERQSILEDADRRVGEIEAEYRQGMLTDEERYQQVVSIWNEATEKVSRSLENILDPYGSISTIAKSGATKAKFQQIRQLSGMRGLMASPSGKIIEIPIRGNYKRGLTASEYLIGSHGARKGAMDRSLNTARSGYLTRKLVEVGQQVLITEQDCGTEEGLLISNEESRHLGLADMYGRLIGRILAEPLPSLGLQRGTLLTEEVIANLTNQVSAVRVRSPLFCQARRGLCRMCYGADLATGKLVALGTAVGIIAAQSIGEPGTQLTMRTFHSGGIAGAQGDITQGLPRVEELFEARVPKNAAQLADLEGIVVIEQDENIGMRRVRIVSTNVYCDEYPLPKDSTVLVHNQDTVQKSQVIALVPAKKGKRGTEVMARSSGKVAITANGLLTIHVEEHEEQSYIIPAGAALLVENGQKLETGPPLWAGPLNPQQVVHILGCEATQRYLVNEVQRVYRTTGVSIHDKHLEVIIRQMLRHVVVESGGDTELLPGEIVDRFVYAESNARVFAQGGEIAYAHPILLGLTKTALQTQSWLAAASFQETSRVLTRAVIRGQQDDLIGLKECIIVGKRIPTGEDMAERSRG